MSLGRCLPLCVLVTLFITSGLVRPRNADAQQEREQPSDRNPTDTQADSEADTEPNEAASLDDVPQAASAQVSDQDVAGASPEPVVIVDGLINPCGIAIQPETGHVFVSDSGAGRVVRIVDGTLHEVITGFPVDVFGTDPKYKIGPLGLAFLDEQLLAVGGGGLPDGEDVVGIYQVPGPGGGPILADAAQSQLGPLAAGEQGPAEGDFYGLAASETALYVTSQGDDEKGWIARATRGKSWGKLERFIATKEVVRRDGPIAVTLSPRGEIVIGQMGEITEPHDSLLSFYGPRTGRLLLNLETQLSDITALAYSPKTGLLYALDFAWSEPESGGLYRLDDARIDGQRACKATRIHTFERPTAMAFSPEGDLYLCTLGDTVGDAEPKGAVVRIPSGL